MSWSTANLYRALCALALLAASGALAQDEGRLPPDEDVVPPGQEELLAEMLGRGATLPADCKFATGQINGAVVVGKYLCTGGEVVLELRHPKTTPNAAARTDQFAIVVTSGTAPSELIDTLTARIEAREDEFQWLSLLPPEVPFASKSRYIFIAGLLGIAAMFWAFRRRRARARAAS